MPTVVFDFEGRSYIYNPANDLLQAETTQNPGVYEPVQDPNLKKKIVKYFLKVVMGEEEPE